MRLVPVLHIVAIAAGPRNHFSARPVDHAVGILAPDVPVLIVRSGLPAFSVADYRIMPAATFSLQARVLATEAYHAGREADLSPVDLALGWGPMSDSAVLDRLQISQGNRFYYYRWSGAPPLPPADIGEHSANLHMLPASDDNKRRLGTGRTGLIVARSGFLVRGQGPDGWHWISSMTRSDSGNGACELVG